MNTFPHTIRNLILFLALSIPDPRLGIADPVQTTGAPASPAETTLPAGATPRYTNLFSGVERIKLPNGLTLLSKEVHAAPVVSLYLFYKVGSRDEKLGEEGLAHLVEHMMFKGTRQLHPGEIHRLFSEWGGSSNASTSWDYTAYHETLPSSALEMALKVEADRMSHSLMDRAEVAREKTVVLSEIESRLNSPAFRLGIAVQKAAFTHHPYGNSPGGLVDSIRKFTPAQVEQFYRSYYIPDNAALVVVGDFKTADLMGIAAKYFVVAPAGTLPQARTRVEEPAQTGERRVKVAGEGKVSYVEIAYHVPEAGNRDHVVMDVIANLLSNGEDSRLSRDLLNRGLVGNFKATDVETMDPFLMELAATTDHGSTVAGVEAGIEWELERLKREPVPPGELRKAKMQIRADFVFRFADITNMARTIGFYYTAGAENYPMTYLSQVESVTAAEIQAAAVRCFSKENRTVGSLEPSTLPVAVNAVPKEEPHGEGSEETPGVGGMAVAPGSDGPFGTPDTTQLIASLNRTRPPVFRQVLPNGLTVIVAPDHSNPDVSIVFGVGAGNLDDPPGKAGLAHLVAHVLHWGSEHFTGEEIARAMDGVGSHLRVRVDGDSTTFSVQCLPEAMSTVMAVLSDEICGPVYRPEFLAGQKEAIVTLTRMAQEDPISVARENLITALYGSSSPYHWTERGTPETRNHIWIKDIEEFHRQHYRPDKSTIVIAGDVDPAVAAQWVERTFGAWKEPGPLSAPAVALAGGETIKGPILKTIPGARENVVMLGMQGIERQRPDFYAAELMNLILGGWDFNSRLMRDLRDGEGLVYHISSSWSAGRFAGPWVLWFESSSENTTPAITHTLADIKQLQEKGVTADEMQVFKNWIAGRQALSLQTHQGVARSLLYAEQYHLGLDYPWHYPALVAAVTPAAVQDAARRLLNPEKLVVSVAGPVP